MDLLKEKSNEISANIFLMAQFTDCRCDRRDIMAYDYLTFQTAYLMAHFLEQLYAAVLSNETHYKAKAKVFKYW